MEYKIQVEFVANACGLTYYPKSFQHPGSPIEACNSRIKEILENEEYGINIRNLLRARIYINEFDKILDVDYRKRDLTLKLSESKKLEDRFWIKL